MTNNYVKVFRSINGKTEQHIFFFDDRDPSDALAAFADAREMAAKIDAKVVSVWRAVPAACTGGGAVEVIADGLSGIKARLYAVN